MFTRFVSRSLRAPVMDLVLAFLIIAVAALSLPQPVSAAAIPSFDIIKVKADESVTIRTYNFPANVIFTARIDVAGNMAIDGIAVGETNSGSGGTFEATYRIPAELRGKKTFAIRLESDHGQYAFNWFNNKDKNVTTDPQVPVTSSKPYLNVLGVKENDTVTFEVHNLPANTDFRVRVGPFYTFSTDYVQVTTFRTGNAGTVQLSVNLPEVVRNTELVTIRVDGGGRYAYNAFKNETSGTVSATPIPVTGRCQIVSVTPGTSIRKGSDFDTVWTVKNTSSSTWELNTVDYKYVSGAKMHDNGDSYDLKQTVKPGETAKVIVDMVAPNTAGYYTANWSLVQGSTILCSLSVTVRSR